MALEVEHALAEAAHIVHEARHLALDEMRLLPHLHVLQDRLHGLHREHEHVGGADHDAGAVRLLHQIGEMLAEIGVDRFGRHEQDGGVLRLAGDEVALAIESTWRVTSMRTRRAASFFSSSRRAARKASKPSSGNLASMTTEALVFGMCNRQSGRLPFESVGLERVGALGQAVLDDGFHAQLAEGAPRLLVGEDLLQAHHVVGKIGQVLLRGVDDGEPLVELGDQFMGLARGLVEVGADPLRHAVEPLVDGAGDVALARHADLGEALEPPFQLGELRGLRVRVSRRRRLIWTKSAMARRRSEKAARPPSASSASTGSTVTLPIVMGSKTIRPR